MQDKLLNKLREEAILLFQVGIIAASPSNLIPKNILLEKNILTVSDINGTSKSFDLNNYKGITVIGAGKASTLMAYELEKILDENINEGPFFNGKDAALIDFAFAPFLIRLKALEDKTGLGFFNDAKKLQTWSDSLLSINAVQESIIDDFEELYFRFISKSDSYFTKQWLK